MDPRDERRHRRLPPIAARAVAALALAALAACAPLSGEQGPTLPLGAKLALTHSAGGPEVDAVVATFYGPSFDPATFEPALQTALARYPDNPDLHEVAAFDALLRGDPDAAELHRLRAALDVDAAAPALYLRGCNADHDLVVEACRLLVKHPNPVVRAEAHRILSAGARFRGDDEEVARQLSALGLLSHWRVVGSFDNDEGKGFSQRYAPEEGLDFAATMPGMLVPVQWRTAPNLGRGGDLPLGDVLWPNRQSVAYAVTFLTAGADADAVLSLNTSSATEAFLDGVAVLARETIASPGFDALSTRVHLAKGPHVLLVKSANKSATWYLGARLTTPEGEPLGAVVDSADPPPGAALGPVANGEPKAIGGSWADALEIRPTVRGARRALLEARLARWRGDAADGVRKAAAFAASAPDNLVGSYFLALASRSNDEGGKALDLLNGGVKRASSTLPRFLYERAAVYMDRGMLEKAQTDAEAYLARRPGDLQAQMLLAQVQGRRSFQVERCRTLADAVHDHPRSLNPLRELARCKIDDGRQAEARALLERAQALGPGSTEVELERLGFERQTFRYDAALAVAKTMREKDPTWLGAWLDSGDLAFRAGRVDDARAYWNAAHVLSPDQPHPLTRLADLAYDAHDAASATRLWTEASARDPSNGLLSERLEHLSPTQLGFVQQFVPTDDEIEAAVASGTKHPAIEGSQTVLLLDDEVTEVHADGSTTRVVTTVTRAVNEQGRDAIIQQHVPTFGRVKLLKAYALGKNGEQQETASAHNGVLRFRNVTAGSTVVVQYIHHDPGGHFLPNEFVADWSFSSVAREHRESRWTLVLPAGRKIKVQIQGKVAEERRDEAGYEVYRFSAKNVPPVITEPYAPPLSDVLAHVSVSTVPGWDSYVRWERALLTEAFPESSDIAALAKRLTKDAESPRARLDRLTEYVAQQIRYQQDYETTIAGVRPHSSRQVVERGYGDCKDKAVLLIALAREVGIDVDFAVLRTTNVGAVHRDVPNQQFNHAIAYVPAQAGFAEPFFVDATTDGLDVGNLRSDDQGADSLVLSPSRPNEPATFHLIPFRPQSEEYMKSEITMRVDADDTVHASEKLRLRGSPASGMRRILPNASYARKAEEAFASMMFPASTLVSAEATDANDLWHPLVVSLEVDASNSLLKNGAARRIRMPGGNFQIDQLVTLAERKLPLHLGVSETVEMKVGVDLPAGSSVFELPQDFHESAPCLAMERTTTAKATHVDATVTMVRTCPYVAPADYKSFRDHVHAAVSHLQEDLAFRVKEPKSPRDSKAVGAANPK